MDYPFQRHMLYETFGELCDSLVLNEKFSSSLSSCFSVSMAKIKNLSEDRQKCFILLELTKNRFSCIQVIKLLRESGEINNKTVADRLELINTSPGRLKFSDDINIVVTPTLASEAKVAKSMTYPMTRKPRGKAIIINNVKDIVRREAQRFECVFKQLLFDVSVYFDMTAKEMASKMIEIRDEIEEDQEEDDNPLQSLIVMVISHGEDENVLGVNGSVDKHDRVLIQKLVKLFDELTGFVKMFFFTCCRSVESINCDVTSTADNSTDTIVFYSSAYGYETFTDGNYTFFGKCLSETIAQYAHKEDLTQIMNRTCSTLRENWGRNGYFSPEFRVKSLKASVYFNPGWFLEDDN